MDGMANSSYRAYLQFVALGLIFAACEPIGVSGSSKAHRGGNFKTGSHFIPPQRNARAPAAESHQAPLSKQEAGDEDPATQSRSSAPEAEASSYESVPLDAETTELLNVAAFERSLNNLPSRSRSKCALYVRYGLEKLFGAKIGGQGDAYQYNVATLNKFASKKGLRYQDFSGGQTPPFQDFDVRVSQPKRGGSRWGHIEMFYKGRWYSDFKQRRSLWDNDEDGSYYSSMKIYRLGKPATLSLLIEHIEMIADWIVPSAFAEPSHPEEAPVRSVAAEARDKAGVEWKIEKIVAGEVPKFELYRSTAGKKILVSTDEESFFLLLNAAASSVPVDSLADNFIKKWIARDGKDAAQKRVSKFTGLLEVQRDAYVRAGFELPVNYNLIMPKK